MKIDEKSQREWEDRLGFFKEQIDRAVENTLRQLNHPAPVLGDAMVYSSSGGKRLRGSVLLSNYEKACGDFQRALPFAVAVELIHAYSLVHDDLPCMDNDDFRRGKPTCHRKYGEAVALLCGDALLTQAFDIMLSVKDIPAARVLTAAREIAAAAGPLGLVGGQVLDIQFESKNCGIERVSHMYQLKTAALFKASSAAGFILAGAPPAWVDRASLWGEKFGYAFQIIDDVEDDQAGESEKLKDTLVKESSPASALAAAEQAIEESLRALEPAGSEAFFMKGLSLSYAQKIATLRQRMQVE